MKETAEANESQSESIPFKSGPTGIPDRKEHL